MALTRFRPILLKLVEHNVDFILVSGLAAIIHAAPALTFDLDIVHSRGPGSLRQFGRSLETLIATKEEAGRDKDLVALPTLRATLAETRGRPPHHHLRVRLTRFSG